MVSFLAPLLANPLANLFIAILLCGLYAGAFHLQRTRSLGSAWIVALPPLLWLFNSAWEITRFGKTYSPTYDLHYLYPSLAVVTVLLVAVWFFAVLAQLTARGESREDLVALRLRKGITTVLKGLFQFLPMEFLLANRILLLVPVALGAFLFFIIGLGVSRSFGGALHAAFGASFFICALEGLLYGLYLFQRDTDATTSRSLSIEEQVHEMHEYVTELGGHLAHFEKLAVDKFHAVTKEANEVFHRAKHIHSHLDHRLQAMLQLLEIGKAAEIEAVQELLQMELDVRHNVVEGIIAAEAPRALEPDEWSVTARHLSALLEEILHKMESVDAGGGNKSK